MLLIHLESQIFLQAWWLETKNMNIPLLIILHLTVNQENIHVTFFFHFLYGLEKYAEQSYNNDIGVHFIEEFKNFTLKFSRKHMPYNNIFGINLSGRLFRISEEKVRNRIMNYFKTACPCCRFD